VKIQKVSNLILPFQTIEHIDEPRSERITKDTQLDFVDTKSCPENWNRIQAISNIILAVVAVVGLLFSFIQNYKSTELLLAAERTFKTQAYPIVRYRSLISGERYEYRTQVDILEDCRYPKKREYQIGGEVIHKIETDGTFNLI